MRGNNWTWANQLEPAHPALAPSGNLPGVPQPVVVFPGAAWWGLLASPVGSAWALAAGHRLYAGRTRLLDETGLGGFALAGAPPDRWQS